MGASVSLVGYGFGVCFLRFVLFFGGGVGGEGWFGVFSTAYTFPFRIQSSCRGLGASNSQRHCLRVRYRTPRLRGYGSGTGPLDTDSRGPVPDPEPRL